MKVFLLFTMLFCHIFNDYNIQGWLANAKQKAWWNVQMKGNPTKEKYKNDYLMALFEHAFSWSFMMELPVFAYVLITHQQFACTLFSLCVFNTVFHAWVDDLKANKLRINLVQDQLLHFVQVVATWLIVLFVYNI